MPRVPRALRSRRALAGAVGLMLMLGAGAAAVGVAWAAPAADEGELLRQIKSDVFDQKWDAVMGGCSQFIAQFPRSTDLPRAYYYRAQALEHSRGREEEAIGAYTDYLTRFPSETGALHEDSMLSRLTLAVTLWLKGNRKYVSVIMEGMDAKGYPAIYAAIQASKIDHAPARAKALPMLKQCAAGYPDAEIKNECVLALLRIDPKSVGEIQAGPGQGMGLGPKGPGVPPPGKMGPGGPPPVPPAPPGPPGASGDQVKLIRVEVYDKVKKQVTVRVNMPVAFAELLLDSLNQELRDEINQGLRQKGVALDRFWDAFKKGGKQTIVEIDDEGQHIKVWVE